MELFFKKVPRHSPHLLTGFSTTCGLPCGKVMIFYGDLCGYFPNPVENSLWTSLFPWWKNKCIQLWEKSFSDSIASFVFLGKWKNSPTYPGGKPVEKFIFPHLGRKNGKKRSVRTTFPKSANSRIRVHQKPRYAKKTTVSGSFPLFHRFNIPYYGYC